MNPRIEEIPKVLGLYLEISQYPILGRIIRERMRKELFERGIITPEQFRQEVKEKAKLSQQREGTPLGQDPDEVWQERLNLIQDHLTDFYFAYNLPHSLFEEILQEVLAERELAQKDVLPFNPELAPRSVLIAQAKKFAALPEEERRKVRHHLEEIVVVLIKRMISDQPDFVRLAKRFLEPDDFEMIYGRRIGTGKIGGKAAGMILAWEILQRAEPDDEIELRKYVRLPESYFIGANVFYDFHALNGLEKFINQKYKTQEEIEADYPLIQEEYGRGQFPAEVVERLRALLVELGNVPLIVRSSSLLEDNFGFSFAGKYESIFCPNQGTLEENLQALTRAIARVYASVLNPDALLYRHQMGLVDFDERMAILIQRVQGQRYGDFFLPMVAGVGFSYNPFRWNRRIRREDGLLRIVWGLGTRAVDRVANDYPRMVPLSHPLLRPETGAEQIRKYSQHFVDLIDLRNNQFRTLPVAEVLRPDYPAIRLLASWDHGDYLSPFSCVQSGTPSLVLTFEGLLKNQRFVTLMRNVLKKLERHYGRPVDIEFTVEITNEQSPEFILHLLQCRPLSKQEWGENARIPSDVPPEDIVFLSRRLAPSGRVSDIRYIVYVLPEQYCRVPDYETRFEIARVIGRLNKRLKGETFILMGPGRWGTSNVELGLKVTYADIYNARALIEIAQSPLDDTLEVSYGTHFFQDLVESRIYPLPLYPNAADTVFNHAFFEQAENKLGELLPGDAQYAQFVKVIDVPAVSGGRYLELVMDGERDEALAYLKPRSAIRSPAS